MQKSGMSGDSCDERGAEPEARTPSNFRYSDGATAWRVSGRMRLGSKAPVPFWSNEAVRGLRSRARVEAEPGELVADLLIVEPRGTRAR